MILDQASPLARQNHKLRVIDVIDDFIDNEFSDPEEKEIVLHNYRILFKEMGFDFEDEVEITRKSDYQETEGVRVNDEFKNFRQNEDFADDEFKRIIPELTNLQQEKLRSELPEEEKSFFDNQKEEISNTNAESKLKQFEYLKSKTTANQEVSEKIQDESSFEEKDLMDTSFVDKKFEQIVPDLHLNHKPEEVGDHCVHEQSRISSVNFQQFESINKSEKSRQDFENNPRKVTYEKVIGMAKEASPISKTKLPENFATLDENFKNRKLFESCLEKKNRDLSGLDYGGIKAAISVYNQDVINNPGNYKGLHTNAGKIAKYIESIKSQFRINEPRDVAVVALNMNKSQKYAFEADTMSAIAVAGKSLQRLAKDQPEQNQQIEKQDSMLTSDMLKPNFQSKIPASKKKKEKVDENKKNKKKFEENQKTRQEQEQTRQEQQQNQQQQVQQQRKKKKGGMLDGMTGKAAVGIGGTAGLLAGLGSCSNSSEKLENCIDPEGVTTCISFLIDKIHHFPVDHFINLFC